MSSSRTIKIPAYLYSEKFLEYISEYANRFIKNNGFGRWIKEYQYMESKNQFSAKYLQKEYIKIITEQSNLDFQRKQAVYFCCVYAHDDVKHYYDDVTNFKWKVCVITGETAVDDDDDELIDLEYSEALQICDAMNDEAEEDLFVIKRM